MPQLYFIDPGTTLTFSAGEGAGGADGAAATCVTGLAVPIGTPSAPSADGHRYQFDGPPDNPDELVDVVREHDDDALVGRLSAPWEIVTEGLAATVRLFNTSRARDVLEEAREGARRGFSVGAMLTRYTTADDGTRHVAAGDWTARHLGIVRRPAFETAGFHVNASATPERTTPMTDTLLADLGARIEKIENTPPLELPSIADLAAQVAEVLQTPADTHPLAAFATYEAFTAAFAEAHRRGDIDKAEALSVAFAVPDQITGDSPGLMPPSWRESIKANIDKRQPVINAFGQIGIGDTGTEINWPYLDPALNLDTIIAKQATQKTALSGVKIKILKGSATLETAGAASDISYQLLERGSPSYLAAHNTILFAAYARYLESVFTDAIRTAGTVAGAFPSLANAKAVRSALFTASGAVEDATGAPAEFAFVDTATFNTLGGLEDLVNPKYGTMNTPGTAAANTLTIDVNGIPVRRARFLAANTLIVSNSEAAKAPNNGSRLATSEDVIKLGKDVAVWGMYAPAEVYFPTGIRVYFGP